MGVGVGVHQLGALRSPLRCWLWCEVWSRFGPGFGFGFRFGLVLDFGRSQPCGGVASAGLTDVERVIYWRVGTSDVGVEGGLFGFGVVLGLRRCGVDESYRGLGFVAGGGRCGGGDNVEHVCLGGDAPGGPGAAQPLRRGCPHDGSAAVGAPGPESDDDTGGGRSEGHGERNCYGGDDPDNGVGECAGGGEVVPGGLELAGVEGEGPAVEGGGEDGDVCAEGECGASPPADLLEARGGGASPAGVFGAGRCGVGGWGGFL